MRVTEIYMTPELAAQMLSKNKGNRQLRKSMVVAYAADMIAGRWEYTHQAIAVDQHGNLVDGQHRLNAVIMAKWSGTMLLATYSNSEETLRLPVDRGLLRATYDVLQKPRKHVECASRILTYTIAKGRLPLYAVNNVLQMHETKIERICGLTKGNKRLVASATTLSALLLTAYAERSDDEVEQSLEQYQLFHEQHYDGMWPHVQAFNGYLIKGKGSSLSTTGGVAQQEMFMRVYMAFDINRKDFRISRIHNHDEIKREMIGRARAFIGSCVE
jgi:hypothetical protein